MNVQAALNIDTPFVSRETPSVADCLVRIAADLSLTKGRRRDLLSGLTRICEALAKLPEHVPADPTWLQPRIAALNAANLGISPKTFANIVSNATTALSLCGHIEKRTRNLADLKPHWREPWLALLASKDHALAHGLGRFIRFLDANNVPPDFVRLDHIDSCCRRLRLRGPLR